jgi:hypothetical protein
MFIVTVSFKLKNTENLKNKFIETAAIYKNTKGLIRKNYIINKETNVAGGVYLFDNSENAYNWFDQERIDFLSKRYSNPTINYFECPIEVNNESKQINIF